ncbi:MAG TPA: methyltransferase domain-containing protein [Anaerovoracaceae bacterium]|nr:methyltransferase domain-containing protein [Anaerovoracaceae bacterium]
MSENKMNNLGFRMMVWTYRIRDLFSPAGKILEEFNINEGDTVVDYGCGPGRYIKKASNLVGKSGKVYAVDIEEIAITYVKEEINKNNLKNVNPILVKNNNLLIDNDIADVIYALDMFHHVSKPKIFFEKLFKIIKKGGILYIEDGHQSREDSINKIKQSNMWEIYEEKQNYLICKAIK